MKKTNENLGKLDSGVYSAIVTPMTGTGAVDKNSLQRLLDYQLAGGVAGIVACGTTGESATLTHDEQVAVTDLVIKYTAGRVPIIAGAGANSTAEATTLTKAMKTSGADAVLSVTPYYNRPSQEGLYQHFKSVASVGVPVVLYNVPTRTGVDMLPETVRRLAEIPNVIGIKEAKDDLGRIKELINTCPSDFLIFSGSDSLAVDSVLAGGNGVVSVASNVAPEAMTDMIDFALVGCPVAGRSLESKLLALMEAMFCYPSPAPAKRALLELGIISSDSLRLPMTRVDYSFWEILREAMIVAGLLN